MGPLSSSAGVVARLNPFTSMIPNLANTTPPHDPVTPWKAEPTLDQQARYHDEAALVARYYGVPSVSLRDALNKLLDQQVMVAWVAVGDSAIQERYQLYKNWLGTLAAVLDGRVAFRRAVVDDGEQRGEARAKPGEPRCEDVVEHLGERGASASERARQ